MSVAAFSLDKFRSQVLGGSGLARNNRFEVEIGVPNGMRSGSRNYGDLVSLYVEQANIPGLNISAKPFKIFGPTYQRPMTSEYGGEGLSMTFHVDRNMKVRNFFEDWMHTIVDPETFTVGYQEDYISTIRIRQLDEANNVTYEMELTEAFPRNMNLMDLNNSSSNQTHRLNILFAYRYWRNVATPRQTTATDIPLPVRFPQVPLFDTRTLPRTLPSVTIGNPMGDLSGGPDYDPGW